MTPIKLSVLPALAAICLHSVALATPPAGAGSAGSTAQVSSSGSMSIGSNGSALSYAMSSQSAHAGTMMTTTLLPGSPPAISASIAGETATLSAGMAYNTSTGAGTGAAHAAGSVGAAAQGTVGFPGLNTGGSGGSTLTRSTFAIDAARNQGSSVQGSTASGFQTVLGVERSGGVGVQATTVGYVKGTNASAALAGMNAGLASIQASGYFSGTGQIGAGTGPRP